jgi:hypothetical protein
MDLCINSDFCYKIENTVTEQWFLERENYVDPMSRIALFIKDQSGTFSTAKEGAVVCVASLDPNEVSSDMEVILENRGLNRWESYKLDAEQYSLKDNLQGGALICLGFLPERLTADKLSRSQDLKAIEIHRGF